MHEHRVRVSWGHCDPAGIVYFPRFFDMFHEAMETWFADALGHPYEHIIVGRKIGFPSVHTEADFSRPTAFGETIVIELSLASLGRSSMRLGYRILDGEGDNAGADARERGSGSTVCAVMDLDPDSARYRRSIPLPDDLRAAMERFMA